MLDNYTFLDGLHSHNLLIMWFFSPCRIFEDVNIQNNNLPPKNCLIIRWKCTSTPFPSLKKKTQNLWIRFVGFPSKLDVSRKLRVEVRKRETFSRGMLKKKKAPLCPTLHEHHSAEWKMTERRKHAVFLNGEGQSHYCRTPTITSLLFFRCLEFGMSTPATAWKEDLRWIQHCCFCVWITAFRHQNSLGAKKQTCEILTRTGFIINFDCISYQLTAGNIAQHTQPV